METKTVDRPFVQVTASVPEAYLLWNEIAIALKKDLKESGSKENLTAFEKTLREAIDATNSYDKLPEPS